jgi:hypothetical protein
MISQHAVRTTTKSSVTLPFVVLAVSLGLLSGWGLEHRLSQRALAAHFESIQQYAARVLQEIAVLPEELRESSGLAISRTQPGVLWSHNDSGDGPNLYALDTSGRILARIRVSDAMARDWEDIAAGPCPAAVAAAPSQESCLYLGDTGDNDQLRREVTIYVVVEPRVGGSAVVSTVSARSINYRYPDRPTDAEGLAVRPNGDITIVSKGRRGSIDFYGIPASIAAQALVSGDTVTALFTGNTGIQPDQRTGRLVTAAAVSPDGMTLAVRTYYEVYFYGLVSEGGESRWRDLRRPCGLGDAEPQGEAIDYLDANTLLLTSERSRGRPGTIHRLQC